MNNSPTYTDLLIRISAPRNGVGQHYAVEAVINNDSLFFGGILELENENLLASIQDNKTYGKLLWKALISNPIERAYNRARAVADETTNGYLRFRLQIDPDCSNLHIFRWERLSLLTPGQDVPISVAGSTPFSRFISRETSLTKPLSKRPIRMTIALANPANLPTGLVPIDVDREVENLFRSLQGSYTPDSLQITILPGRSTIGDDLSKELQQAGVIVQDGAMTMERLQDQLLNCDLLHFMGHGIYLRGEPEGQAALYLEKPDGSVQIAKDNDILSRLGDGSAVPRLVFLAACESAKRSEDSSEPFVGLGPKLIQAGVPAVIGMQDLVPIDLAQQLSRRFYHGLFKHGIIDLALNDARLPLLESKHADWSIPVLFMRIKDGRLFEEDPLRSLLKQIVENSEIFFRDKEPPLPLDVVRISGSQSREVLLRQDMEKTPGADCRHILQEVMASKKSNQPQIIILLGSSGTAKTSNMRYLSAYFARHALSNESSTPIVAIISDLSNYPRLNMSSNDSFYLFLLKSMQEMLPSLTDKQFTNWLQDDNSQIFLFIIDGLEKLPNKEKVDILKKLERFANNHQRHHYLVISDYVHLSGLHLTISDFLVVKPLTQASIKGYLEQLKDKAAHELYQKLVDASLFDIASLPWILLKILNQIRRGISPQSRSEVLGNLEQEFLADIPHNKSFHTHAAKFLNTLGWEMQQSRLVTMNIDETLRIMQEVRGNREYKFYELLSELIEIRVLVPVGEDCIRFVYPGLQAWFAAQALASMPHRIKILDDITATLGRLSRLLWWGDTLVLFSGSTDDVNSLLRLILYGGHITEGEQVFLAARCIQEAGTNKVSKELFNHVVNTLILLSSSSQEPRAERRQKAVHTLGLMRATAAIPHLVRIVLARVRSNWQGEPTYEYSSVRLAAVETLKNMADSTSDFVNSHYPQYSRLLQCWITEDIDELARQLVASSPTHQSIAAFILGGIGTRKAGEVLLKRFQQPGINPITRWSITDALLRIETNLVTRYAILPFLDKKHADSVGLSDESWKKRQHWYERVAYLIGKINPANSLTNKFLADCLTHYQSMKLKFRAIRAIGAIGDANHKKLLENLATGDFSQIPLSKPSTEDLNHLQRVSIESLGSIGDQETLILLQQISDGTNPELQTACHNAGEQIVWRQFEHNRTALTGQ